MARLVFDIGGTKIRSALFREGKLLDKKIEYTKKTKEEILNQIKNMSQNYKFDSVGVGIAGFVGGNKVFSPHLPFKNFLLRDKIENILGKKTYLANDAKCAGLAENKFGSGKNFKNFIFLTLGTGIGGAIFIDKKLYLGRGNAGEFGHINLLREEFEKIVSGSTAITLAKAKGIIGEKELLIHLKNRDPKALRIYQEISKNLGNFLVSMNYIFDTEAFIIGGGLSNSKEIFIKAKEILKEKFLSVKLLKAKFGDDAGLIGAGLI